MKYIVLFGAAAALSLAACQKKAEDTSAATAPAVEVAAPAAAPEVTMAAEDAAAGPIDPVPAAASAAPTGAATPASSTGPTEQTEALINGVALTDLYQIQAGKIAEARAQSPAVKEFGTAMVTEHTAMTNQMKHLFAATKVKVPTELGPRGKRMIAALNAASDADFDRTYLNQQQSAQAAELTLLRVYADAGESTDLKPASAKRIPKVQSHLEKVQELQASLP